MKTVKQIILLFSFFVLLFSVTAKFSCAFSFRQVCQPPLRTFSNGNIAFDIKFPPGGGTTCDTISDCPKFSVPPGTTIFGIKVDLELSDPISEIGTPYIWVPVTSSGTLKQIDTKNCNLIETYNVVQNPSRTYVIPGGNTWVANRVGADVSKLSPLTGDAASGGTCGDGSCGIDETLYSCPTDCSGNKCGAAGNIDCRKYEVKGNFTVPSATGGGVKGITGDSAGNVWTANYNNGSSNGTVSKLNATNWPTSELSSISTGGGPYGTIGDPYGHIWISNRATSNGSLQCINTLSGAVNTVASFAPPGPYGIGMGNDGSIYVAWYEKGAILKFNAVTGSCPVTATPSATYDTSQPIGTRGIAVDKKGYVWTANSGNNTLYVFKDPANRFSVAPPGGSDLVGVAIDFDGYGWVVSNGSGMVYKYKFDDTANSFNLECSIDVGTDAYNYSDMTGLRTVPKTITIGSTSTIPTPNTSTYVICAGACNPPSAPCPAVTNPISCTPDAMGKCEIPIKVFSLQTGSYTLRNLEVSYGSSTPVTTGGLVPCGRVWNDPKTPWDDTATCDFCHIAVLLNLFMDFLVSMALIISILAIVFTGFLFITSGGNPENRNKAKSYFKGIMIGFFVIFLAWLLIDFLFIVWGFLDPMGGQWNVVCE